MYIYIYLHINYSKTHGIGIRIHKSYFLMIQIHVISVQRLYRKHIYNNMYIYILHIFYEQDKHTTNLWTCSIFVIETVTCLSVAAVSFPNCFTIHYAQVLVFRRSAMFAAQRL